MELEDRENRILERLRAGAEVPQVEAQEYATAKRAVQASVLADTAGGLFGPDAIGQETANRMTVLEEAVGNLETALGIE